ncbi:lactate dehydrogenase [Sulfitobacter alexandrii]|uniref:Lactate dehydrogenase n=1 Tax=Sulfitobacter alexandrii TaxID=1917485 RepID=A0A1J0WF04_9RHOB|nr:Ldh family oxidoreductase [Sulfitobacter alexandrii]APE42898.1 lactate dehydrogenase [Sulfitobacter alexandrii]
MAEVSLKDIAETVQAALMGHGADTFAAAEVARAVAAAESTGNRICGLAYVESYCRQLTTGRVRGDVTPAVTTPRSAVVHVDARFGFAQPAFAYGLTVALDAARQHGVATLAVSHAHTCTALGYFTEQIARAGLIGIGFTNASPVVAAPGGRRPVIGTNPVAFSVPDGRGGIALQVDQSTTTVALGKIAMARAAGEPIPEGWALDAEGNPTTDPEAALKGTLTSAGGYKGWGFGLMAEILAAGMAGSVLSKDVQPLKAPEGPPHDLGQYYIVIDPSASADFGDRLAALAEAVAADPGARMPGQHKSPAASVDVPDALWTTIRTLAGA